VVTPCGFFLFPDTACSFLPGTFNFPSEKIELEETPRSSALRADTVPARAFYALYGRDRQCQSKTTPHGLFPRSNKNYIAPSST
jgi:hypothetical protein